MIQRANGSGPKCDVCIKKEQKLIARFATWWITNSENGATRYLISKFKSICLLQDHAELKALKKKKFIHCESF